MGGSKKHDVEDDASEVGRGWGTLCRILHIWFFNMVPTQIACMGLWIVALIGRGEQWLCFVLGGMLA